jgi:pyruvate formate lyase activating enzyme
MSLKFRMSRRDFLSASAAAASLSATAGRVSAQPASDLDDSRYVKEARYYEKLEGGKIKCTLCPHECEVADMERGTCSVRENRGGTYYTLVHSRPCTEWVDPIEKKPLSHFLPGSRAFSIATAGCNMGCKFCQNWRISQFRPEDVESRYLAPEQVVALAKRSGCKSIAYTYSEPVVFYEYMYDTAVAGRKEGVRSVIISNGFINQEPVVELCKVLDAVKVDLKAFTEKFYRETCVGELKPVLDALKWIKETGVWLELVVLIIPTLNDSRDEIKRMCEWVCSELGPDVPMHFSRFGPTYMIKNLPKTPPETLKMARNTAVAAGIKFAYVGNLPMHEFENTYCPKCNEMLIRRIQYHTTVTGLEDGKCQKCATKIPGVWS